jgi:N4-gp56 family major capsid protein
MPDSGLDSSSDLRVRQYDDKAWIELNQKLVLKPYMGTTDSAVIQVKENLMKSKGDQDTFALRMALAGEGVEGDATLEGNEEEMEFRDFSVSLQFYKNAVRSKGQLSERRSAFDLKDEAMNAISDWGAQKLEKLIFNDFASIDGVAYGTATEAEKDAWLVSNADRVLFGATTANNAANDHSACLLEIDSTADVMQPSIITLAKTMAKECNPRITPIRLDDGEEMFVFFLDPLCVRDLKNNSNYSQMQRDAQVRGSSNPVFTGALGVVDNVILKEAPRCLRLAGVGASTIQVAANFLCGAQAAVLEWGGMPSRPGSKFALQEESFDYKTKWGVAGMMMLGHGKTVFNDKQHGVVTVYASAVGL